MLDQLETDVLIGICGMAPYTDTHRVFQGIEFDAGHTIEAGDIYIDCVFRTIEAGLLARTVSATYVRCVFAGDKSGSVVSWLADKDRSGRHSYVGRINKRDSSQVTLLEPTMTMVGPLGCVVPGKSISTTGRSLRLIQVLSGPGYGQEYESEHF